jgi:hypothetical protein
LIPAVFVFAACPFAQATSKRVRTTNLIRDDPFLFSPCPPGPA